MYNVILVTVSIEMCIFVSFHNWNSCFYF